MTEKQPHEAPSSDIVFSPAVKRIQEALGSRTMFAEREATGGFHTEITPDLAAFISSVTTSYIATASLTGQPTVQHRGGPAGFLHVRDKQTIMFVDFAGNQQYISLGNISENPQVALILMDYEGRRRVKIWGTAEIVADDPALLKALFPKGYRARAKRVIAVTVSAWDINCSQHIPQMFPAARVGSTVMELQQRIDALTAENLRLRAQLGSPRGPVA
jgi:uncharacterized protein